MADKISVITMCGSLRKGSYNAALARLLPSLAPPGMAISAGPSIKDFPLYNQDDHDATGIPAAVTALADAIRAADGLIVVSPEYNWSIPGTTKNAIDWLSRLEKIPFADKPVALQSCSRGLLGGARMQYHLRQTLACLDALLFSKPEVFVTFSPQKFDKDTLELKDQPTLDMIKAQLVAFEKFVRRMTGKN